MSVLGTALLHSEAGDMKTAATAVLSDNTNSN